MKLTKATNFGYGIITGTIAMLIYQQKAPAWLLIIPALSYAITWLAIYFQQKRMKRDRLRKMGYFQTVKLFKYETGWTLEDGGETEVYAMSPDIWDVGNKVAKEWKRPSKLKILFYKIRNLFICTPKGRSL